MRRRKRLAAGVLAVIVLAGAYVARVYWISSLHADACHVIASRIAEKHSKARAAMPQEIDAAIAELIQASVIHGRVRADGSPTDYNGNPYVIDLRDDSVTVSVQRSIWQPIPVEKTVPVATGR